MPSLSQNASELHSLVQDFLQRFREVDATNANGPQADLSMQELRVVERLGDVHSAKMKELAEYMPLAVNSVTSLVDNLEERGLVKRDRSVEDRRVVNVALTDSGLEVYEAAVAEKRSLLKLMLGALNVDEREVFMTLFRKIARAGQEGEC